MVRKKTDRQTAVKIKYTPPLPSALITNKNIEIFAFQRREKSDPHPSRGGDGAGPYHFASP